MKSVKEIEEFEKLEMQLHAFRREMAELSKKKPHDGVNKFKLRYLNQALTAANEILSGDSALDGFEQFDLDEVPSNSDVVFVLAHYTDGMHRLRARNTTSDRGNYYWVIRGRELEIHARNPDYCRYED
jgi:hypothetical protein